MKIKKLPIQRTHDRPKPANSDKFNIFCCIDTIFLFFSKGIKFIGPAFAFTVAIFILISTYCYFLNILPFWFYYSNNIFLCFCFTFIGLSILFQLLFNYILSVLVKPGTLEDISKSVKYKTIDPLNVNNKYICFKKVLNNKVNIINMEMSKQNCYKKSNITIDNTNCIPRFVPNNNKDDYDKILINKKNLPECKYCRTLKAVRAHHCSVCNQCVFKMDHHCPWINNCIGQNNQRYFILFLVYVQFGTIFIILLSAPIWWTVTISKKSLYFYVSLLNCIGFIIASFFSYWQWKLIILGRTTIEHWTIENNEKPMGNIIITDFSFNNWRDNLFIVFGTHSILKALFIPNMKMLPYSGLEWTKIAYPSFELSDVIYNYKKES